MTARRRPAQLGVLFGTLVLAAGCGSSEPEPLTAIEPEVPANLCATVPAELRKGLVANANADQTGNPTAACSLRSPDGRTPAVRAVVTWLQAGDDISADEVYDSQCRSVDLGESRNVSDFKAKGAARACAASGTVDGADSSTMAAVTGREVLTVRVTSLPAGDKPALKLGQQMLEGVLADLS